MVSRCDPDADPILWRVSDALGAECRAVLPAEKAPGTPGRPAVPFRRVLEGIPSVLRTGCQWRAVPREFGSISTVRARFQQWAAERTLAWLHGYRRLQIRFERQGVLAWAFLDLACALICFRFLPIPTPAVLK